MRGVQVMRLYLAPALDALLDRVDRPALVLDVDEIESDVHAALGDRDEAQAYARLESYYLPRVDLVIACSHPDAALVAERHRLCRSAVVPNAVRPPTRKVATAPCHDLVFVGNLSYAPNVDAVRWLGTDVCPLLPPGVTIALVGSAPGAEVREQARRAGMTLAADVADVAPWYASARVAIAPLRQGGGTRIKVLEALAYGRPVVATSIAARGLPGDPDDAPVLVVDAPEQFAESCWRLLADPDLREELAERGPRYVRDHATLAHVAGMVDRQMASLLER
jgi:glycosyltransferase involved in cell wall biosynthesis